VDLSELENLALAFTEKKNLENAKRELPLSAGVARSPRESRSEAR
jgi:hypothetical protein